MTNFGCLARRILTERNVTRQKVVLFYFARSFFNRGVLPYCSTFRGVTLRGRRYWFTTVANDTDSLSRVQSYESSNSSRSILVSRFEGLSPCTIAHLHPDPYLSQTWVYTDDLASSITVPPTRKYIDDNVERCGTLVYSNAYLP